MVSNTKMKANHNHILKFLITKQIGFYGFKY